MNKLLLNYRLILVLLTISIFPIMGVSQVAAEDGGLIRCDEGSRLNVNWAAFAQEHPALKYHANTAAQLQARQVDIPEAGQLLLGAAPQSSAATAQELRKVTFWGHVLHADNWASNSQTSGYGLHYFTNETPIEVLTLPNTNLYSCNMSAGGLFHNGMFYYINHTVYTWGSSKYLYIYDTTTDPWTNKGSVYLSDYYLFATAGVAVDPTTDIAYGIFSTADGSAKELSTIDYSTQKRTAIATVEDDFVAFTIDNSGQIFVIGEDGNLYKMDKTTAVTTLVGSTGVEVAPYIQSATYDSKDGVLYWAAYTGTEGAYASALYTVNTVSGLATKVGDFPYNTQISMLTIPKPLAEDAAPAAITDLTVTFEAGSLKGKVAFTAPTEMYAGGELTGTLDYTIRAAGNTLHTATVEPGDSVVVDVEVPASGSYDFVVVTSNSVGKSPEAKASVKVGFGKPYPAGNVTLTIDATTGEAVVTWRKVEMCNYGEYLGELTFDVVRYPDNITVASGISETTFTETLSTTALKNYSYGVYQVNGDVYSNESLSNSIVIGSCIELPYRETFKTSSDFDLWTVVDANNDGREWKHSYPHQAEIYTGDTLASDDWLISPPIAMEEGRQYTLTLKASCNYYKYTEKLQVLLGTDTLPETFTTVVVDTLEVSDDSEEGMMIIREFDAPSTGQFRLGIRAVSDARSSLLYIDELELVAGAVPESPSAVTDVVITPAELGALQADITFNAPTTLRNGEALEAIERIDIFRNYVRIESIENPTPGETYSYVDNEPKNGINTYMIVAYNERGNGDAAKIDAYVGIDIPLPHDSLATLRCVVDHFDGTFTLKWPAPNKGQNGGYVNPDELTYNVYERGRYSYTSYKLGLTTPEITIDTVDYDADVQVFTAYGITAVSEAGESQIFSSAPYLLGRPYTLPFADSFKDAKLEQTWWSYTNGDCSWSLDNRSYDNDGGVAVFTGNAEGATSTFFTGKIDLRTTSQPTALFRYKSTASQSTNKLGIVVNSEFATNDTLDIEFIPNGEWQVAVVDLSAYKDKYYIMMGILGISGNVIGEEILVDAVRVVDMPAANLLVHNVTAPDFVRAGNKGQVDVTIENMGFADATNFVVSLYIEDKLIDDTTIELLNKYERCNATLEFVAASHYPEELPLTVVIEWSEDVNLEDNTMTTATTVQKLDLTSVWITGNIYKHGLEMEWEAPENSYNIITDSFESYEAFTIDNFNPWTTIDGDGAATYFLGDVNVPNAGNPMAFQVFNPTALETETAINEGAMPYDGDQYLISFNPAPVEDVAQDADDWLISPELPGIEQTISFFAKSLTSTWGNETFEILYSTTGKEVADFIKIGDTREAPESWTSFEATLPEGAKYFAIHVISNNKFAFMIDEVSYYAGETNVISYNVYRNNELIANLTPETLSYADFPEEAGLYTWFVTAVYEAGESNPSNPITIYTDGSDAVQAAGYDDVVVWYNNSRGTLDITSSEAIESVELYDMQGVLLYANTNIATTQYTADVLHFAPAVYVAKVNTTNGTTIKRFVVGN